MEHKIKNISAEQLLINQRQQFRKSTFQSTKSAEHHLELVEILNGVEYINDSVSVSIDVTWQSLERLHKEIVWIVGGESKNNDYEQMRGMVREKVKHIICLGKEQAAIFNAYHNDVQMLVNANSLQEAISIASKLAHENQCVLFSPACPSYDEFENYEKRGQAFKAEVSKLKWGGI